MAAIPPLPRPPVVSVITPAYNAAATIQRAFDSLSAQTFDDWEYIVVDDGSSDATAEIVSGFSDRRVKGLLRTANRGSGAALNTGLKQAAGRYIAFLDADDEFLPAHLQAHVAAMDEKPDVDLLWGGIELVISDESQAWVPDMVAGSGLIHISECVVQGTLFARRHVFDTILYSEDRSVWYQDLELVRNVQRHSFKVRRFDLPTYRYYRDSGNSQVDRIKAEWESAAPSGL